MLVCAPLLKEDYLSAYQYFDFVTATVDVYNKTIGNVVTFIEDNWAINQKLSDISYVPLITYAIHRLNPAVEDWI